MRDGVTLQLRLSLAGRKPRISPDDIYYMQYDADKGYDFQLTK